MTSGSIVTPCSLMSQVSTKSIYYDWSKFWLISCSSFLIWIFNSENLKQKHMTKSHVLQNNLSTLIYMLLLSICAWMNCMFLLIWSEKNLVIIHVLDVAWNDPSLEVHRKAISNFQILQATFFFFNLSRASLRRWKRKMIWMKNKDGFVFILASSGIIR